MEAAVPVENDTLSQTEETPKDPEPPIVTESQEVITKAEENPVSEAQIPEGKETVPEEENKVSTYRKLDSLFDSQSTSSKWG